MTRWEIEQAKRVAQLNKSIKTLEERLTEIIPETYASFAVCFTRHGWSPDQIEDLFVETQEIANEFANEEKGTLVELAEKETGICLRSPDYVGLAAELEELEGE